METRVDSMAQLTSAVSVDQQLDEIRLIVREHTGVLLRGESQGLAKVVEEFRTNHRVHTTAELIQRLRACPPDLQLFVEASLPGKTAFFRWPALFAIFQDEILPEIARKNGGACPLRIWSAGCSTGEEAYSIAIAACEGLAARQGSWNMHIVAGDIRRQALSAAERGLYPAAAALHLPSYIVRNYFSEARDQLLVRPRVRDLVTFSPMNLIAADFLGRFHCIFCIDVLAHLSAAGKAAAWQRLQLALEPGGYIFLGEGDQLPVGTSWLRHSASVYQRPFAAAASAGR